MPSILFHKCKLWYQQKQSQQNKKGNPIKIARLNELNTLNFCYIFTTGMVLPVCIFFSFLKLYVLLPLFVIAFGPDNHHFRIDILQLGTTGKCLNLCYQPRCYHITNHVNA